MLLFHVFGKIDQNLSKSFEKNVNKVTEMMLMFRKF